MSGESFSSASIFFGDDGSSRCITRADSAPILVVDCGLSWVKICIRDDHAGDAVRFARELAEQAQAFAAEAERLHAAQAAATGDGAGTAAGEAA